jgi:protein-S-isoprenylcysteine O-methyltransferase Ste14
MRSLELRIAPVFVVAAAASLMWLVARLLPDWRLAYPGPVIAAAVLFVAGGAISLAGVVSFRRAHTTVNPMTPKASSSLVTSGIYAVTRNPMYLGFAVALAGWGALLGNPASFMLLPLFVWYMNRFQIAPEERALASRFGAQFEAYRRRVRRWL